MNASLCTELVSCLLSFLLSLFIVCVLSAADALTSGCKGTTKNRAFCHPRGSAGNVSASGSCFAMRHEEGA